MIRSAEPDQTAPWGAADKGQLCKQFMSACFGLWRHFLITEPLIYLCCVNCYTSQLLDIIHYILR